MLFSLVYFLVRRLLAAGGRRPDEKDIELLVLRHQGKVLSVRAPPFPSIGLGRRRTQSVPESGLKPPATTRWPVAAGVLAPVGSILPMSFCVGERFTAADGEGIDRHHNDYRLFEVERNSLRRSGDKLVHHRGGGQCALLRGLRLRPSRA